MVARVEHKCYECGATINPGEEYENCRWIYPEMPKGKRWHVNKTCWFCLCIRRDFFDCGWAWGGLREDFYECQGWDYMGEWGEESDEQGTDS